VVISEQCFGLVEPLDVFLDRRTGIFDQSQFVPQRLHLFAPFMKVGSTTTFTRSNHGLTTAFVCGAKALRKGPKSLVR
jgi:hypothetical protein